MVIVVKTTSPRAIRVSTPANPVSPNVIVANKRDVQVSSEGTAGYIDTAAGVLINMPTMASSLNRLRDVDTQNQVEGGTLVYDVTTGKYVVSYLDLKYVKGSLAGGTF